MWMWRENRDNPHYRRLILIVDHNPRLPFEKLIGIGVVALILAGIWGLMSLNYESLFYLFLFILFIFTMLTSAVAAWFVARDCSGIEYELVRLTVLPSRKLASGYWFGFLRRLRWQLRWAPLIFPFIVGVLNLYYFYFKFINQPAFVRDYYWEQAIGELSVGWLVSLTVLGGYWIYPLIGISIGLSLNRPMLSSLVTIVVIPILAGIWFSVAFFVYLFPILFISIFGLGIIGQLIMITAMLGMISFLLFIGWLVMAEMTHGFAKENI